jgi:enoyl-CoA hydratase/carnithine racemase
MRGGARGRARALPAQSLGEDSEGAVEAPSDKTLQMDLFQPPVVACARMGDNLTLGRDGAIATVTLNRPDRRNSLSDAMLSELAAAFVELRDDDATRVVVVTGAPPVFSAGADAGLKSTMSADERRQAFGQRKSQFRRLFERANTLLEGLEQATIAMINGHAVGGGWGLTLACDFRWAAAEAQLWIPEVDLGVPLGVASTTRFVRLVGPARAKEIIMECRRYSAAEAQSWGLVHRVVPGVSLAKEVRAYAETLAAKPFKAMAEVKARINAIARTGIPEVNAMTEGFLDRG